MGKIRTRMLGIQDVEEQQKKESKQRAQEKKVKKQHDEGEEHSQAQQEQSEKDMVKKQKKSSIIVSRRKNHGGRSLSRRGKQYREAFKAALSKKPVSFDEALTLLKKAAFASFDESIEVHMKVDKTGIKGEVAMPHATGKTVCVRIADDAVVQDIEAGKFEFDVLVAHPSFMPKLVKFAKVLGPKGLMPNPKSGTVSQDPEAVAKKLAGGVTRWKTESKQPLIHQLIGKMSHDSKAISENYVAFVNAVGKKHIISCHITSSMGPSVAIDMSSV